MIHYTIDTLAAMTRAVNMATNDMADSNEEIQQNLRQNLDTSDLYLRHDALVKQWILFSRLLEDFKNR